MILKLPLTNDLYYTFVSTLGDTTYDFTVRWNERGGFWTFDMVDNAAQKTWFTGLPILLGCDLFDPFNIGNGSMIAWDESGTLQDAGYDDLGSRVNLYWFDNDEIAAILATL